MADPISLTAGLLSLITFAFGACQSLFQAVEGFQNQPKDIFQLKSQLQSLKEVLSKLLTLSTDPNADNDTDLAGLKPPLLGCGEACKDLETLIKKCIKHSTEAKPSVRDWARLKVHGDRIKSVQTALSMYKATIGLAVGAATLRTTRVTKQALDEYNALIIRTTKDLKDHLNHVEIRLQNLPLQDITGPGAEENELQRLLKEKHRTDQCLHICQQISESINCGQSALVMKESCPPGNMHYTATTTLEDRSTADEMTFRFLSKCSMSTREAELKLERRLHFIQDKLKSFPADVVNKLDETITECCYQEGQKDALTGCLSICEDAARVSDQARTNVFEDIYAAKKAKQVVISDVGDLISAKRVRAGPNSRQYLGQISNPAVLHLDSDAVEEARGPLSISRTIAKGFNRPNNPIMLLLLVILVTIFWKM
ncbi:hypothetical protein BGW36DRAFT_433178 [Talaromyces proteolyticus]|uniref:Azaphilone pigments biosynthesis cluster protein L N-terminal domain-containing protein n=1 Tax=Talaromyces proteolyticus TaxID=1131652 RepID=A0AAD4KK05_9EURO|nr:uncharacterized protein BGW36DRAFT_433178 [Talaromyces proteolyticus]KAH8690226.1 hypothetical protein BGW36DRAFT_433178 [Talaromyces proteolyticus]